MCGRRPRSHAPSTALAPLLLLGLPPLLLLLLLLPLLPLLLGVASAQPAAAGLASVPGGPVDDSPVLHRFALQVRPQTDLNALRRLRDAILSHGGEITVMYVGPPLAAAASTGRRPPPAYALPLTISLEPP